MTWQQGSVEPMHTHGNVTLACIVHGALHCIGALNVMHTAKVPMHLNIWHCDPSLLQRTQTNEDMMGKVRIGYVRKGYDRVG